MTTNYTHTPFAEVLHTNTLKSKTTKKPIFMILFIAKKLAKRIVIVMNVLVFLEKA